jgi:AcrR family transcriptional regulator
MAGKRKRDDAQVRRALIIDLAIGIIGQLGYHGFTVQDLAARCGLSNAGLLYHFASKEQLFDAVVAELEQREIQVIAPLIAAVDQAPDARRRLSALIDLLHAMVVRGSGSESAQLVRFYAVLQAESLDQAHPAHDSFRRREFAVLELFTRLLAPHVREPQAAARQLLALIDGLRLQWLRSGQAFNAVSEWIHAVTVLVPALAPLRDKQGLSADLHAKRSNSAPRTSGTAPKKPRRSRAKTSKPNAASARR